MAQDGVASVQEMPTLLIVSPGADGRRPMLKRLQRISNVCVLVSSEEQQRCGWTRAEVGADNYIEWDSSSGGVENAMRAIDSWLGGGAAMTADPSALSSGRRIDGAMSYDEFGIEACALVVEHLGLLGTPSETLRMLRDKSRFRERCAAAGVPGPRYVVVRSEIDLDTILADNWPFPCVIKPVKGSGSWHVQRVDSPEELRCVYSRLVVEMRDGSFPQDIRDAGFMIEEYITGHEVDVDGWARAGVVEFAVVSDNRPAKEPFFLELGGFYPSQESAAVVETLERLTSQVVSAFSGIHTCFHFEAKIDLTSLRAFPIEMNCRCAGAECPASLEAVSGYNIFEVAADLALGRPTDPPEVAAARRRHAVVASTNHHVDCHGIVEESNDADVDKEGTNVVTSVIFEGKVGQVHVPNNGSRSCFGWLATGGSTLEEAESNLRKAIGQTKITVRSASGEAVHLTQ
eukprot:TRINITY_DN13688_c2_g1_i1.p1 TRINITY_DN13688_c2_g1~~TRINITY_DN13688_c2_g1_i1.p1  ORF type:complete len:476 (-),score=81.58 TRINITY_DN13688_c2_g1_i1:49-1425(-)